MEQKVFIVDSAKHPRMLKINLSNTLSDLIKMFLNKFEIDLSERRLTFGGKELDKSKNWKKLSSLNIKNNSRILVVGRALGGKNYK